MGVLYTPDSAYAKEMVKWEAHHTQYGPPGRPYDPNILYPAMMYKAWRSPEGKIEIKERLIADDETMQRNLESRGFVAGGPGKAVEAWEKTEFSHAELAAERNFHERKMSPAAQAEAAAANAEAGAKHLPEVPELPVPAHRKRKYTRKAKA